MHHYQLTKENRIVLARAFDGSRRVDLSIDCIVEGQMGKAFVNDSADPAAFMLQVGPMSYFAGDCERADGRHLVENLAPHSIIMPSPDRWIETAREIHGERLIQFPRYSFSSAGLSIDHLDALLEASTLQDKIVATDSRIAGQVYGAKDHFFDLSDYESADDFVTRGIGYCLMEGNEPVACAYSSLICSKGAEVSIFVLPEYRRKGVATALACALLSECLRRSLDPHWDAANIESCLLAEKLGYAQTETYDAFYLKG